jgi:hypothetical protein
MKKEAGQILLFTLVVMVILISVVAALVGYAGVQIKSHRQAVARESGISIAEAGVETAIWKLNNQIGYVGEASTPYANGVFTVAITNLTGASKLIRVDSYIPDANNPTAHRTVQVSAVTGTKNLSFNYGLQVGDGGFIMDNNSQIIGNVFSNGPITGSPGATITEDAIVAGPTGTINALIINGNTTSHTLTNSTVGKNANHYSIVSSTVTGNVSVNSLSGPQCSVTGNAVYNTRSNCSVSGTITTPNSNVPVDPTPQPLPIEDDQVQLWEQEASAGGTVGSQLITTSQALGPIKINGDLTVDINATLIITGTIWVTGNVTINNGSTVQVDSSFGAMSGGIIAGTAGNTANGYINVNNNVNVIGSGTAGSFLMLLSQRDTRNTSNYAITAANNSSSLILYAKYGQVEVINNAQLKEITAWKVRLHNNAIVTYDAGLAGTSFSSGPSGGWQVAEQTWQLLQ